MLWYYIDTGVGDAYYNMALDEAIAQLVIDNGQPPVLRLYGWSSEAVSVGVFQPLQQIDIDYCKANRIAVVRRPTGGRAILHGNEVTYSFASTYQAPFNGGLMDTYRLIGTAFVNAFSRLGISVQMREGRNSGRELTRSPLCFQSVSIGEVSFQGKKLIGSAQKRWKEGFLQQGSIPLLINHERLKWIFRQQSQAPVGFAELLNINSSIQIEQLKEAIVKGFEEVFGVRLQQRTLYPEEQDRALILLEQKYQSPHWNEKVVTDARRKNETPRQSSLSSCSSVENSSVSERAGQVWFQ